MGEVDAVGADVDVGGPFDHGADVAGGLAAEGAGGDASAAEAAGRASCAAVGAAGRRVLPPPPPPLPGRFVLAIELMPSCSVATRSRQKRDVGVRVTLRTQQMVALAIPAASPPALNRRGDCTQGRTPAILIEQRPAGT